MFNLRVNGLITLDLVNEDTYIVKNRFGSRIFDYDDDFYLYMVNVNLKGSGVIQGRFKGLTNDSILDDRCKQIKYISDDDGWFSDDGKRFKTARMVAIENKSKTVIIIQNE